MLGVSPKLRPWKQFFFLFLLSRCDVLDRQLEKRGRREEDQKDKRNRRRRSVEWAAGA